MVIFNIMHEFGKGFKFVPFSACQITVFHQVPCAVLKDSGDVVTLECVEKLIKPDMRNPITGVKLRDKDIIPLQRVSTPYLLISRMCVLEDGPSYKDRQLSIMFVKPYCVHQEFYFLPLTI